VPHSYNYEQKTSDKVTPMHHHIVVSLNHVIHNNPSLKPEEHARIHRHILDIHGGQESDKMIHHHEHGPGDTTMHHLDERTLTSAEDTKKEEIVMSMKKKLQGFKERYGKDAKSVMYATATKHAKRLAEAHEPYHVYDNGGKTADRYTAFTHADHEHSKKTNRPVDALGMDEHPTHPQGFSQGTSAMVGKHLGKKVSFHSLPKPLQQHIHMRLSEGIQLNEATAPFMTTYKRNESSNRHTANIVHLAKHFGDEGDKAQAKFYADELKKHGHNKHHEAQYELHKKLWPKAAAAHSSTKPDWGEKPESWKNPNRYKHNENPPHIGESIMEKSQLVNEELHAYDVHHRGKHIDTIFYGHNEPIESVKKSLVNHDGYHPDITVKKQPKQPGQRVTSARWDAANKKLEESEQLTELSKGTLKSYIKKAVPDLTHNAGMSGYYTGKPMYRSSQLRDNTAKAMKSHDRKEKTRSMGIQTAASKLEESSHTLKTVRGVLNEAFTRRHFKLIAELIKGHTDAKTRQRLADTHAAAFEKDNPRFDHARFHAAAGTVHKKD
jgi:hypothetical protein